MAAPHTTPSPTTHLCSSSPSHRNGLVVALDEARSPLLFHGVRPSTRDETNANPTAIDQMETTAARDYNRRLSPSLSSAASPTTTSIQYLEDPTQINRMFRLDTETLGLFGTARQRHKKQQEKIVRKPGEKSCCDEPHNGENKKQKNSHSRAVLHNALDLRCMEYKVVKIIEKNKLPASSGGDKLWRRLCHKLLRVTNSHQGLMHITDVIETDTTFYLISERLDGRELFEFLLLERAVPEELCKYLIKQILHALDFLHSNSLLHRDVKPENLMFRRSRRCLAVPNRMPGTPGSLASTTDSLASLEHNQRPMTSLECSRSMSMEELRIQFELALIDFDTCKMIDIPSSEYHEVYNGRRRLVGTYGYLAPEVLRGHEYTMQSDLWSVGVILYILMTGIPPVPMDLMLNARSALEVLQEVKRKGIDFCLSPLPEFPKAQDLCIALLEFDPPRRICSARHALNHAWLNPSASNTIPVLPFLKPAPSVSPPDCTQQSSDGCDTPPARQTLERLFGPANRHANGQKHSEQNYQEQERHGYENSHQLSPSLHVELLQEENMRRLRSGSECLSSKNFFCESPLNRDADRSNGDRFNEYPKNYMSPVNEGAAAFPISGTNKSQFHQVRLSCTSNKESNRRVEQPSNPVHH